ncbi:MAG: hypothetical protein ABIP93_01335, partial [Gemmatimonadaceae bacterium]
MQRTARRALWAFLVIVAGVQGWLSRHAANTDGVGYLDQSDQFLAHGWHAPTNGYWSPLYPALLAAARWMFGSGPALDYPLAHLVNFIVCIIAFGCGEWLRRELVEGDENVDHASSLLCIGLVGWAAIRLIGIAVTSPDMGVLACVLGAAAALLRWRKTGSPIAAAALSLALGLGYLMKAVMFPIAIVYLVIAVVVAPSDARRWRRAPLMFLFFGAIALPQVVAVSRLHGRPTFGQSGALNQAWHIGGVPGPLSEDHARPTKISVDSGISLVVDTSTNSAPRLFLIDGRAPGTFPIWSDVTRWYPRTIPFHVDWRRQVRKSVNAVRVETGPLLKFIFIPLLAWLLLGRPPWFRRGTPAGWTLVALGVVPLGLYALVNAELRLVAPFEMLVVLGLSRVLARAVPLALLAAAAIVAVGSALLNDVRSLPTLAPKRMQLMQLAAALRDSSGGRPRVVALGDIWQSPMYARLARARVVAIMDDADAARWWRGSALERAPVEARLDSIPGAFVIARSPDRAAPAPGGWSAVPG